jgi:hypothetical protein
MRARSLLFSLSLLLTAALLLPSDVFLSGTSLAGSAQTVAAQAPQAANGSLLFIENVGQFDPIARFQVWGGGQTLWLAEDAIWITMQGQGEASPGDLAAGRAPAMDGPSPLEPALHGMPRPYAAGANIRISFPGANPQPVIEPFDRLDTHISYFIGADPDKWRADVPVWGGVRYRGLYPGLDLELTATGGRWSWRVVASAPAPAAAGEGWGAFKGRFPERWVQVLCE